MIVSLLAAGGPADAGTLQQCMNQGLRNGEPPSCTNVNGNWVPSWSDGPGGSGIPGVFVFLFVVVLVVGIGTTIWKVSTAQKLARQSGMDPRLATQMTLLTDDGLDATYLAASMRRPQVSGPTTPTASRPQRAAAADRLTELRSLLDRGLVTQQEYDERRKAIIDGL